MPPIKLCPPPNNWLTGDHTLPSRCVRIHPFASTLLHLKFQKVTKGDNPRPVVIQQGIPLTLTQASPCVLIRGIPPAFTRASPCVPMPRFSAPVFVRLQNAQSTTLNSENFLEAMPPDLVVQTRFKPPF